MTSIETARHAPSAAGRGAGWLGRRGLPPTLVLLSLVGAAFPLVRPLPLPAQTPGDGAVREADPADAHGRDGGALYAAACAACHGADGAGAPPSRVAFDDPLPDFTSCTFASREPDADWVAVAHAGGPVRGFSEMMPAFGDALTLDELQRIMDHVRTFCGDDAWPRGELNLPRAMVTEKAYPEDEAVVSASTALEGPGSVMGELVYERRFGARNQVEVVVPFGWREREPTGTIPGEGATGDQASGAWAWGLGDVALGVKRALFHSLSSGTIVSAAGEVILPTGDESEGFGTGTVVFEPFLAVGQILPADFFLHAQAGAELPVDGDRAEEEAFWRGALGWTLAEGPLGFGRAWSPMVEVLASRELADGASAAWDLLPQLQVTLNTRQHVMANVGVRLPLNDTDSRDTRLFAYVLWDWFDGGLFEGW